MAVPGRPVPAGAPADLAAHELFAVDAYLRDFEATVSAVDPDAHRVALSRTAFYPGGGGQPHDLGVLRWGDGQAGVTRVARDAPSTAQEGPAGSGTGSTPTRPSPTPTRASRGCSTGTVATSPCARTPRCTSCAG